MLAQRPGTVEADGVLDSGQTGGAQRRVRHGLNDHERERTFNGGLARSRVAGESPMNGDAVLVLVA